MTSGNLADLGARALLDGYRTGKFTPTDAMESLIARIDTWEPSLNALYAFDAQAARDCAVQSTQRWARQAPMGMLDGVPVTLKELIATRGTPTPLGSAATELKTATRDAPPAARLREAGAIIFAKTTAPDYGMLSSGLSSFHKLARNPWDLRKNPGGSSAGAAAAAAAGYGPLHVGTDIGGSVRLPAAWCGVVGFKPTLGRIPIDPYYVGRCAGPMTRTVDDAAWLMQVLAQPDSRDATSLPPAAIDWFACAPPRGLRIGLMLDAGCGMNLDPEIAAAIESAAALFARTGATITRVQPVLTRELLDGIDLYWRARLWSEIGALPTERRRRILPYILAWAEKGATVSGPAAIAGFNATYDLRRLCAGLFEDIDVVLSPTTANISFPAEWASPLNDPARPFDHICYTLPWNMSEQPALSINCGFSEDRMPIGLQLIGPRFSDGQILALARWYESQTSPPPWPSHA